MFLTTQWQEEHEPWSSRKKAACPLQNFRCIFRLKSIPLRVMGFPPRIAQPSHVRLVIDRAVSRQKEEGFADLEDGLKPPGPF